MLKFYFRFVHPMIYRWFLSKSLWKFTGELLLRVSIYLPSYNVMEWEIREKAAFLLGSNSFYDFRNITHLLTKKKITLKSTYKSNPELSIVVCSKKDKSAINVNLDIQSNFSLYYIFIKPDTPNNFNYSSIQYLQKWTNYTSIIDYISCIVCYVLLDRSMEKRDKKEIASWILNQLSIGIIQTFVFFCRIFCIISI